ncbi:hypothetical protein MSAN_02447300 [Mycena sanguinolenta]|uniref:Uncharacterized protein n=1 Tax=Mycena sanguinolenta TaxID=230812 RepID=A0A8H7CBC7_9AGAR|nr:hypothetical protein MSAN_02447300 [Mycena sanguinolenta]
MPFFLSPHPPSTGSVRCVLSFPSRKHGMHLEDVHLLCTISLLLLSPVNTPRLRSMVISHLQARRIGTKIKPRHWLVTSAPSETPEQRCCLPLTRTAAIAPVCASVPPLPFMRVPFARALLAII